MTEVTLHLEGMSCAACASRIERSLNELDGVQASVNLITDEAVVAYDDRRLAVRDLVRAVEQTGYGAAVEPKPAQPDSLRARLTVAAALSIPLALVAMVGPLQAPGWEWAALALATPVVFWAGWPFHRSAVRNLRHGGVTMDTLVSLGTLAAWGWSAGIVLGGLHGDTYFEVAAVITTLILLGRSLETRARARSRKALEALAEAGASDARVLRDGVETAVPAGELAVGDVFVVRPGEKFATDGVVLEGTSAVERSLLTGEPLPEDVAPGDEVVGGTLNVAGRLLVRATRVGSATALAQIARLVRDAQAGKAPVQRLADRISAIFVPVVLVIAGIALVLYLVFK